MAARTSRTETEILRRVATSGQDRLAIVLNHDSGHISRIIKGERGLRIYELEDFLATLGLQVVEADGALRTVPEWEYQSLVRKALAAYARDLEESNVKAKA
jgi:hypothetical protein